MDHVEHERYERIRHRHARRLVAKALSKMQEKKKRAEGPTEAELVSSADRPRPSYQLSTWFRPLADVSDHCGRWICRNGSNGRHQAVYHRSDMIVETLEVGINPKNILIPHMILWGAKVQDRSEVGSGACRSGLNRTYYSRHVRELDSELKAGLLMKSRIIFGEVEGDDILLQ